MMNAEKQDNKSDLSLNRKKTKRRNGQRLLEVLKLQFPSSNLPFTVVLQGLLQLRVGTMKYRFHFVMRLRVWKNGSCLVEKSEKRRSVCARTSKEITEKRSFSQSSKEFYQGTSLFTSCYTTADERNETFV